MFIFTEAGYQLFRNRWRTAILLIASAMLCGCVAFYLGSIEANKMTLDKLSETIPVNVYVIDRSGTRNDIMNIEVKRVDILSASPYLRDIHIQSVAAGAIGEEARAEKPFVGGDVTITAVNCLEALNATDGELELAPGIPEDFLEGSEAMCLLDGEFARDHGLGIGESITMPMYLLRWDSKWGWVYASIGQQTLKVAGTWTSRISPQDMVAPVGWLREVSEEVLGSVKEDEDEDEGADGNRFVYTSCSAALRDPMELDRFKASALESKFAEPDLNRPNRYIGNSLAVEDERFITTAEQLSRNIAASQRLMPLFFLLVTGLVVLVIFLVLRGARKDMAVSVSLGRSKLAIAGAQLIAVFSTQLAGGVIALPVMVLAGLGLGTLSVCGIFLLCALLGDLIGIWAILRFDALKLLLGE